MRSQLTLTEMCNVPGTTVLSFLCSAYAVAL